MKKYIAFTLAEVLLVTAIVAIVSALTIPNIKKNYENKALKSKAQAVMSKLETALMQIDLSETMASKNNNKDRSKALLDEMANVLKLSSNCGNTSASNYCFTKNNVGTLDNYNPVGNEDCASAVLNDSTEIAVCIVSGNAISNSNVLSDDKKFYGYIAANVGDSKDINLSRGKNVFFYVITEDGALTFADSTAQTDYEANSIAQEY